MDSKLKKMARVGFVAKGIVYGLTGILTFLTAFNMGGGKKAGKLQVIEFLEKQPFGNVLLVLIGLGLLCYSIWRFIQAFNDPENIGNDKKGKVKRVAFFVSAIIYLFLSFSAFKKLIDAGSSGGGGKSPSFLAGPAGVYIFAAVGLILVFTGIAQFKKAYDESFLKKFDYKSINEEKRRKIIKNTGYFGLTARGVIFLVLAYIFIHAALISHTTEIKGTKDAFSFLQTSAYGSWLLGLVAVGLVCYAVYVFMLAKYRKFKA